MPAVTRPVLPPLQTPKTASFPSEIINTPVSCVSTVIKQEKVGTPITPPVAYTEFLKALTPVLTSPPETAVLHRSMSDESTTTRDSLVSNVSTTSSTEPSSKSDSYKSPSTSIPPTPFTRQNPSALRRLRIPPSPAFSPTTSGPSPRTAASGMSTGSMLYSPFSPADWNLDSANRRYFDTPRSACPKPVSVRSVVTRTVTYKRSPPLDPPPKGKRRKIEDPAMPPPLSAKDASVASSVTFPSTLTEQSSTTASPPSERSDTPPAAVTTPPTAVA